MRIKLHVMNLEKQDSCVPGRRPQDFVRMLLLALGPDDGLAYTTTEYLRVTLPGEAFRRFVTFHASRLNNLANSADNPFPPANQDEIDAAKANDNKKIIPKRWTRQQWLTRISDQRYHDLWLLDQWMKREALFGTLFYYDTDLGKVVTEAPPLRSLRPAIVSESLGLSSRMPAVNNAYLPVLSMKHLPPKKVIRRRFGWSLLSLVLLVFGLIGFQVLNEEDRESLYRQRFEVRSSRAYDGLFYYPDINELGKTWQSDGKAPVPDKSILGFIGF